ncbi:MAG TPA: ComEA family DNA-binding protein [Thermoleophilaceae bacterium]|nr:ComEA family DNA-binding protein [Thermoleophilaceae bacterium]
MERNHGQVLVWVVAAVLATLALVRIVGDGEHGSAGAAQPIRVDRSASAAVPEGESAGFYVHVAGRVRRPGLYRVPANARVAVAIERAGGPAPGADVSAVNLAARVEDGQQIVLPRAGAAGAGAATASGAPGGAPGAPASSGAGAGAKLSLAQASQAQLEELDGIGPTLAKRILEYRDANGGFRSLGELKEVEGIGVKRFQSLSEAVVP